MEKGLRYNKGKNRIELIPAKPIQLLGEVYSRGAHKYSIYKRKDGTKVLGKDISVEEAANLEMVYSGADNWRNGLVWTEAIGSVERHINAFKSGEDIDKDLGTYHLANAAWGLFSLLEFYGTHPELDDRHHAYLKPKKIGLDIDGVLADFNLAMDELCGGKIGDPHDWNNPILCKKFAEVKHDPEFWLGLKPMVKTIDIPFEPHCYITSRSINTAVTKEWLDKNGFPDAPIYSVGVGESKVEIAKASGIDYFIDDYMKNFVELNKAGICTFLLTRSYNKRYDVGYKRINDFNDFKQRFI